MATRRKMAATVATLPEVTDEARATARPAGTDDMLRELLRVMQAVRDGNFGVTMPGDWSGVEGKLADTLNEIVMNNRRMAAKQCRCRSRGYWKRTRPS